MKAHRFLLPLGFRDTTGKARLAIGQRDGVWGFFCYPHQDDETEACREAAKEQFSTWFLILTEPKTSAWFPVLLEEKT